jgi:ABC-type Zn uptake system ZnuABC Zn-binding protein ZnuA
MFIYHFKNIFLFLVVFAVVAAIFVFGIFRSPKPAEVFSGIPQFGREPEVRVSEPLFTAVSAYPFVSDILRQIGGPFVAVHTVSGGKISAQEYAVLQGADAFFVLDEGADAWVLRILEGNDDVRIFRLREGRKEFSPELPFGDTRRYGEEYYWLSPDEMGYVARFIARSFGELDSVHTLQYLNNAYSYEYALGDLGREISDSLSGAARATFSSYGYGFTPVLVEYGLKRGTYVSVMRDVQKRLQNYPKEYMLVDVAFPVSGMTDTGARKRVVSLDPYGNLLSGDTYIDFIWENMGKLLEL